MPSTAAVSRSPSAALWRVLLLLPLAFAALCASASQGRADWAQCATENGRFCQPSAARHYLIRYGADNRYFFREVEGQYAIGCNNVVFGDPIQGTAKSCDYMEAPTPKPGDPSRKIEWSACPGGGICNLPRDKQNNIQPRMVRFGTGGKNWSYKIESGAFPCTVEEFDVLGPFNGVKVSVGIGGPPPVFVCQFSSEPYASEDTRFTDCAAQDSTCRADGNVAVFRYGRGERWVYKVGSAVSFFCNDDTFGGDPVPGQRKSCQVAPMPAAFTEVVGGWHEVQSCQGACTLQKSIAVAVTGSRQKTVTTTWGQELSVAIEKSFGVPSAGGGKVSASFKVSHSEAVAVQESLSHQETKMQTVSCSPGKDRSTLYQWGIDADEMCYIGDGHCRSSVSTLRYLCAVDPPAGYRPVCAPEACVDALCTKCTE